MIRALDRKLIRDLFQMKGQVVAICAVIACGLATFVMSLLTLQSLQLTRATYYDRYRFAHVFAHAKRAPETLAARIAEIPGVSLVQTRIVMDVTLDVPGLNEPAIGRLISTPEHGRPLLNDLYLRSGRWFEPGSRGEALVSEAFADAHKLVPGDRVRAVINGRRQELRIVGVALSPEYIFQIRPGEILPDDKRFGIFWMGETELEAAFNMDGAFNDVTLGLMRGASEPDVLQRLDDLTEPFGGIGAFGRDDQTSHKYLSEEIEQLRGMAVIIPSIFLGVAAFLLNVVLSRLISTQREQVAALKAFGYTRFAIGMHYVKFVLIVVVAGVAVGSVVGVWLGRGLTDMYTRFYKFPVFLYRVDPSVIVLGLGISAAAGIAGTLTAVRRAVVLPPAEAMRPEPPANFKPTVVERLGLGRLFTQSTRMVLRQLERRPLKSALSSLGIAMAAAVVVLGSFTSDALDYLMDFQFRLGQRQNLTVTFVEPTSQGVMSELTHLPGVVRAEPFRSVPVRLRSEHRSRRVGLMGVRQDNSLYRLLDREERPIEVPEDGLLLSEKLAELLGVEAGETVTVEVLEGERPVREVPVARLVADFAGTNAYMDVQALNRTMREGPTVSGAFLAVDRGALDDLYTDLKNTPRVASVTVKEAAIQSFKDTVAENLLRFRMFNMIFASIIAFGVVYNTARISLSERSRELATLRVIGFTRAEISAILLGELGVLTVAAIPLGLGLGYALAAWATMNMDTELYRIPLVVNRSTYGFAAAVVLVACLGSGLIVRRKLDQLDLVAVLKSKE